MLAGLDDELAVCAQLAFAVAQRGFVGGRDGEVAMDVPEPGQAERLQLGADGFGSLFR